QTPAGWPAAGIPIGPRFPYDDFDQTTMTPVANDACIVSWSRSGLDTKGADISYTVLTTNGDVATGLPSEGRVLCAAEGWQGGEAMLFDAREAGRAYWLDHADRFPGAPGDGVYTGGLGLDGVEPRFARFRSTAQRHIEGEVRSSWHCSEVLDEIPSL